MIVNANVLSGLADSTVQRYSTFTLALTGARSNALDSSAGRTVFEHQSAELIKQFATDEAQRIAGITTGLVDRAVDTVKTKYGSADKDVSGLYDLADTNVSMVRDALLAQASKDRSAVIQDITRILLQADMIRNQTGMPLEMAKAKAIAKAGVEQRFTYKDRMGRTWGSERYVRLLVRGHYLATYNESVLYVLLMHGVNVAKVNYLDPERVGEVFNISEDASAGLRTYEALKNEIFHPNSSAVVIP